MMKKTFTKRLSANDVGATGGHQGGILIPKSEEELLAFLPTLEDGVKNPDAWIECTDEGGTVRSFRFVYYNNRFYDTNGTRNEYRITHMTKYFREIGASEGDNFNISKEDGELRYTIRIVRPHNESGVDRVAEEPEVFRIKITTGWRRVH